MLTRGLLWRLTSLTLILIYGLFTLPAHCLCRYYLVLEIVPGLCSLPVRPLYGALKLQCQLCTWFEFRPDQISVCDGEIYFGPPCCQRVLIVHCSVIRDQ